LSWQFVVLGTGSPKLEGAMQALQRALPDRVRAELRFDDGLARQIYAGADVLLMPSRYEPCGLAQLIAMRYGCVPIVTAVGGLKDTVVEDETGFILEKPTASRLATAIKRALKLWDDKPQWAAMQRLGMSKDFSWAVSAAQYRDLYQTALSHVAPS
jgi:starch synthase